MIGSDAKDFSTPGDHSFGGEALRAEDICLTRITGGYAVDHVSLTVRAGEIVGLYGLMGAGRSEFLECVMGRHPTGDRPHMSSKASRCASATSAAASPAASR